MSHHPTPFTDRAAATIKINEAANALDDQRKRLLDVLRTRSITTLEARRELDVLHPAARILELRKQGHDIQTLRVPGLTDEGKAHIVARDVLRRESETTSPRQDTHPHGQTQTNRPAPAPPGGVALEMSGHEKRPTISRRP